jgi:hypothetical protein
MKANNIIIIFLLQFYFFQNINAQTVYYDNDSKLYGIIDRTGKIILKPTFKEMRVFENGLSKFLSNGKWGLLDEKGKIVIKPIFETEYDFGGFSEGLISLKKNEKWGYANLKGEMIVDFIYDNTIQFCNDIAWVQQNGSYNFIDLNGKLVSDIWFEQIFISKGTSFAKAGKNIYEISIKEKKLMDSDFIMDIFRIYCDTPPANKLIRFRADDNSPYGYKDQNNKVIIEPKYRYAEEFREGFAIVYKQNMIDGVWQGSKNYVVINEAGVEVFTLDTQWVCPTDLNFENGLLEMRDNSKNDYILINTQFKIIKRMNEGVFHTQYNF